jgi:hypothetical protein
MRYAHFGGVGRRIRERLVALGYVNEDGEADIARFIREKRYDGRYFYAWANKDRTPTGENLDRLADDLDVPRAWLLLGEGPTPKPPRRPVPIGGGSSNATPSPLPTSDDVLCLIGTWLVTCARVIAGSSRAASSLVPCPA